MKSKRKSAAIEHLESRKLLSAAPHWPINQVSHSGQAQISPPGGNPSNNAAVTTATGSISGDTYVDSNGNGAEDPGETYLSGVQVYVDANQNGQLDPGETVVASTSAGMYTLGNLPAGNYQVREIVPSGYALTQPTGGFYNVALAAGQNADDDFGNQPSSVGIIRGSIFNDLNSDGIQNAGEPHLQGWTAYLDLNLDGNLDAGDPTAVTDSTGYFTFQGVAPGNYRVREVVQSGWTMTRPPAGFYDVTLAAGQTITDRIFGDRETPTKTTGVIGGSVFNDLNASGTQNSGEPSLSGWTVYLDLNQNGQLDSGEPSAITSSTGVFVFPNLSPGNYRVREVVPAGWTITKPASGFYDVTLVAGGGVSNALFGNHHTETATTGVIGGTVFNDANANGVQDSGESRLQGWTVYLDTNLNGQFDSGEPSTLTTSTGVFIFPNLAPGNYRVREVAPSGWTITTPASGFYDVTVVAGGGVTNPVFGDHHTETTTVGAIAGNVFNDLNSDAVKNAGEMGLANWLVFIDANNDGKLEKGETSVATDSNGNYLFGNLPPGSYHLAEVLQGGWRRTTPGETYPNISVTAGNTAVGTLFGNTTQAVILGTVFKDVNGNGHQDEGDTGLGGFRVYLDLNGDGVWDNNEPSSITSSSGGFAFLVSPGAYTVGVVPVTAYTPSTSPLNLIAGSGSVLHGNVFGEKPIG